MKAAEIIRQISRERGIDPGYISGSAIDLVPPDGLNVHKRDIWNLSITSKPGDYFSSMAARNMSKTSYSYKFQIASLEEGKELCRELSKDFGTPPCEICFVNDLHPAEPVYLAIHIHPEFDFVPRTTKQPEATQEVVLNFV